MEESGLPIPEFRQVDDGHQMVRVVLRNNIRQRKALIDSSIAASIISPEIYRTLTDIEKLLLNHLAQYDTINTTQAVRITGKGWKSVHRVLLRLAGQGILLHRHSDKAKDPNAFFTIRPKPPK